MSVDIVLVQVSLSIFLFFIINWIGKYSYSLGYLSISIFLKVDEAPAFNFIIRILSPVVYLFITSAILYALNLDKYTYNFYLVSLYYILFRLMFNVLTERTLLLNWYRQIIYWIGIMILSYYGYKKIIITKENLLPDFSNLSNELWIVIIVFIYQIVNKIESSNESTIVRKENYLFSKYRHFQKKYDNIISKLKNKRLIVLAYSILIYENFNRPYIARIIENIRFVVTSKPHTLGVMQVYSGDLINDTESVRLGVEKIMRNYTEMLTNPKEEYIDKSKYSSSEYSILEDLIAQYNGGSEYRTGIIELMNTIEEKYYKDHTDKLTDGFK